MADCHIGGWREKELTELGLKVFENAIDECIKRNVGFILISGDLFNTALPSIDLIKETASILKKAKNSDIDVYIIPGSHDFSPSGKTMIDVLEKAGLLENVMKFEDNKLVFTEDKTGVKITGIYGRKGGLEKRDYETLKKEHLENEKGFKIFMFHTAINEFKPAELEKMKGQSFASLPKNFHYYAGGHVHYVFTKKDGNSLIVFPGALFPNNFKEMEEYKGGGFFIVDDMLNHEHVKINLKEVVSFEIDANGKRPEEVEYDIRKCLEEVNDKIVTLRISGRLEGGKPSDVNFKKIFDESDAYCILRNTSKLKAKEIDEIEIGEIDGNVEEKIIDEFFKGKSGKETAERLIKVLNNEKLEGEKVSDFEDRVFNDFLKEMEFEEVVKDEN